MQGTVITPFSKLWGYGAYVTIVLIAVNCAIWLTMVITSAFGWLPLEDWWYKWLALTPDMVYKGYVYQPLTSVFLHDGSGIWHVLINMYLLWVFGPRVERTMSSRLYLIFYLVTGVSGSLLSLLMRTLGGEVDIPSLGASSSVFGVLVAYGFLYKNDLLLLFFIIPVRAWIIVLAFIGLESLFILMRLMDYVDHWGHLGGAGAAAVWMWILVARKGLKADHGWYRTEKGIFWKGRSVQPQTGPRPRPSGFRLIEMTRKPTHEDHPEGTDDEPAPRWFEL
jgi:membrane associated rhomboid family serine protease